MKESKNRFQNKVKKRNSRITPYNRLISGVISASLIITTFSGISFTQSKQAEAESYTLSNPQIEHDDSMEAGQKVTWDCVWFGSYPQAEVVPESEEYTALSENLLQEGDLIKSDSLYNALKNAIHWNDFGDTEIDGEKYRRVKKENATYVSSGSSYYNWENETTYHYFKYQPIKWRVLSVEGSEALLLADKALDDRRYHEKYEDVTWEGSTIRSWLNGYGYDENIQNISYLKENFIDSAFYVSEQSVIKESYIENKDNLSYGTDGGNNTTDKIFLLSESEVYTDEANKYGFVSNDSTYDEARRSKSSSFAKAMGTWSSTSSSYVGNCYWRLRSPGAKSNDTTDVSNGGWVSGFDYVDHYDDGVRPALNLNLNASSDASSSNLYSYAGTVCSDGTVDEVGGSKIDSIYTDKISADAYGVTEYQKTKAGELYYKSKDLVKAYNDCLATVKSNLKSDYRKANGASKNFKDLRKYDESAADRKTNQLITFEMNIPDEAIDDTYEVLYDFLKKCLETGVDSGVIDLSIDVSQSPVEIEAKIVNKIYDEIKKGSESFCGTGSNGYVVQLKTTGIFGISFGGLTVQGVKKGKQRGPYTGVFCSDGKLVSNVMNQFIEDLSSEVKELYKNAAFSLWNEFKSVSLISEISGEILKDFLVDKAEYLIQQGYGDLLSSLIKMEKGYDLIEKISSAKNSASFFKVAQSLDFKEIYSEIKNINYTDKKITNEFVKNSMEKIESCRKNLEDIFFDYLYNDNTLDDMNFIEKTQYYWKAIWQCPVDVTVYDESGDVLGAISNNSISFTDKIYMELNGDVKTAYLPKNQKVTFKLTGLDEGSMNYILEEYDGGKAVARLNYYDVPLEEGMEYTQEAEIDVLPDDLNAIPLLQTDGARISADEYIPETDKTANIDIDGVVEGEGIIYGTGKYAKGDAVELTALSSDIGYSFIGWYEEGALVNYDAVYRFTALEDKKVTALFEKIPVEVSDYVIKLSDEYKENGNVALFKSEEDKVNIVISLYDTEKTTDMEVTIKKYDADGKLIDTSKKTAVSDGSFRFIITDVLLKDWSALEIFGEDEKKIVTIGDKKEQDNKPENNPTSLPKETQTPISTGKPVETQMPMPTGKPVATQTPITTNKPQATPTSPLASYDVPSSSGGFNSSTQTTTPATSPIPSPLPTASPKSTSTPKPTTPTSTPDAETGNKPLQTSKPTSTKIPSQTDKPNNTDKPSKETETGSNNSSINSNNNNVKSKLKKGSKVTDKKTKAVYKITKTGKKKAVQYKMYPLSRTFLFICFREYMFVLLDINNSL